MEYHEARRIWREKQLKEISTAEEIELLESIVRHSIKFNQEHGWEKTAEVERETLKGIQSLKEALQKL